MSYSASSGAVGDRAGILRLPLEREPNKVANKSMYRRRDLLALGLGWATVWAMTRRSRADVGGANAAAKRARVIAACTKHWAENSGDCSGFVKSVVEELHLGFALSGRANDICDQIAKDPWVRIGVGNDSAAIAGITAGEGKFVLAGLAAPGNGHVAVVVDYRNAFDSYEGTDRDKAVAFWGKLHSVGQEYTRITQAWRASDLYKVLYAYMEIP